MLLGEPAPTPFDLNFHVAGVPVRVHPLFFVGVLVFSGRTDPLELVIFGAAVFLSLLVHELGHVMAFAHYGIQARVVLHFMGGLAIPDRGGGGGIWSNFGGYSRAANESRGWSQIVISAAGPLAGFALAAVVVIATRLAGGHVEFHPPRGIIFWNVILEDEKLLNLKLFIRDLLFCNIVWGLLNSLPIFPLDGGQISRQLFIMADPWRGITNSLWLSMATALAVGIWMLTNGSGGGFGALFFFVLAYGAFQQIQFGGRGRPW